jgi:hypothetical protein
MNPKRLVSGTGAAFLAAGGLLAGAARPTFAQAPPGIITAEQARAAALAAVPGTVLEVELERFGGRVAYEVEVRPLNGGTVVEVLIDASNSAVLIMAGDDGDAPGDQDGPFDDD